MFGQVDGEPETHAPGQQPQAKMDDGNLHAGGKAYAFDAVFLGQQIKVGNVAIRHPSAANFGIGLPIDVLPAVARFISGAGF